MGDESSPSQPAAVRHTAVDLTDEKEIAYLAPVAAVRRGLTLPNRRLTVYSWPDPTQGEALCHPLTAPACALPLPWDCCSCPLCTAARRWRPSTRSVPITRS